MSNVTRILNAIEQGDAQAADELLPLVYEELRLLAAQKMAQESPGQTLQATALVHEAYIRLVGSKDDNWNSRGHFFAAAAEAMRRILIENARRKRRRKYGGEHRRVDIDMSSLNVALCSGRDMTRSYRCVLSIKTKKPFSKLRSSLSHRLSETSISKELAEITLNYWLVLACF